MVFASDIDSHRAEDEHRDNWYSSVLKRNRLRWFGHVELKDEGELVRKCMYIEEGARPREAREDLIGKGV